MFFSFCCFFLGNVGYLRLLKMVVCSSVKLLIDQARCMPCRNFTVLLNLPHFLMKVLDTVLQSPFRAHIVWQSKFWSCSVIHTLHVFIAISVSDDQLFGAASGWLWCFVHFLLIGWLVSTCTIYSLILAWVPVGYSFFLFWLWILCTFSQLHSLCI